MIRFVLPLAGLALLAACDSEPEADPTVNADANAEGDVLEGSISDAMLPLDSVTSKSPSARNADDDGAGGEGAGDESE